MAEYPPREAQESRCCWECGAEEAEKNSQERPTKMLPTGRTNLAGCRKENRENALACRGRESRLGCVRRMKPVGGHRPAEERFPSAGRVGKFGWYRETWPFAPTGGERLFYFPERQPG